MYNLKSNKTKVIFSCLFDTLIQAKEGFPNRFDDIEEVHQQWTFNNNVLQFLREKIMEEGYKLCIISNISAINEGVLKPKEAQMLGQEVLDNIGLYLANTPYIEKSINSRDVFVGRGFYFADYVGSPDARPQPDLLNRIIEKYGISRKKSIVLGDSADDVELSDNARIGKYIDITEILPIEDIAPENLVRSE